MKPFKQRLSVWTDIDWAAYELAASLGLMEESSAFDFRNAKHVFWTRNPIGDLLFRMLDDLVEVGVLEKSEDGDQYRWNSAFKGTWE